MPTTATLDSVLNDRQHLYRLSSPYKGHTHVVVSYGRTAAETLVFPADVTGTITDLRELPGSTKGVEPRAAVLDAFLAYVNRSR